MANTYVDLHGDLVTKELTFNEWVEVLHEQHGTDYRLESTPYNGLIVSVGTKVVAGFSHNLGTGWVK